MAERITVNSKKPVSIKENLISHKRNTDFRSNSSPVNQILHLQRTIGNQAVQRMVGSGALQAKLRIGQPGDKYEQEADRVADAVMRMPEPGVHRQIEPEEEETLQSKPLANQITPLVQVQRQEEPEEEEEMLQTKPLVDQITPLVQKQVEEEEEEEMLQAKSREDATSEVTDDLESQINAIKGGGRPLAESERAYFEPRFGADFSQVKVHTDTQADESARAVNARAFTMGRDLVFGAGQYAPGTNEGKRLLGHELAHVIQQDSGQKNVIRRYTTAERTTCPCLDWSLIRMNTTARIIESGGLFTGRFYASTFMRRYLDGVSSDAYVNFSDFKSDTGGAAALTSANNELSNQFLTEADSLSCGGSRSGVSRSVSVPGHFTHGTDLYYAMGGFSLEARGTGSVEKTCDDTGACTGITATMDIRYRVNDLYDWKADPGGCTPSTGESGCIANTKTATFPVIGLICDECLNRLAIHGWASEFMVKVRGRASGYTISGPCGFQNPTTEPDTRDNQREDA